MRVIEHVDGPQQFLQEIAKILKPRGVVLLSTPNILHPYSRLKFAVFGTYWLFDQRAYFSPGHVTPLPVWMLKLHMERAGFEDVRHGFAGSLNLTGIKRLLGVVLRPRISAPRAALGSEDDAGTLFVAATKP